MPPLDTGLTAHTLRLVDPLIDRAEPTPAAFPTVGAYLKAVRERRGAGLPDRIATAVAVVATTSCEAAAQAMKRPRALASPDDELLSADRSAAAPMPVKRSVAEKDAVPAKVAKGACEAEAEPASGCEAAGDGDGEAVGDAGGELLAGATLLAASTGVPDGVELATGTSGELDGVGLTAVSLAVGVLVDVELTAVWLGVGVPEVLAPLVTEAVLFGVPAGVNEGDGVAEPDWLAPNENDGVCDRVYAGVVAGEGGAVLGGTVSGGTATPRKALKAGAVAITVGADCDRFRQSQRYSSPSAGEPPADVVYRMLRPSSTRSARPRQPVLAELRLTDQCEPLLCRMSTPSVAAVW